MTAYGALAVQSNRRPAADLATALSTALAGVPVERIEVGDEVRASIRHDGHDQAGWLRLVQNCLSDLTGADQVALGYAAPRAGLGAARRAMAEATEALRISERVFGFGHATGYGEAQLAAFLLRHADVDDLRSLYERTIGRLLAEDGERYGDLLATLEAYCDTGGSIQGTAQRLGVHRNTVLYRVRRIQSVMVTSLEDGPSRLLLQVGLMAGRLVQVPRPSAA